MYTPRSGAAALYVVRTRARITTAKREAHHTYFSSQLTTAAHTDKHTDCTHLQGSGIVAKEVSHMPA